MAIWMTTTDRFDTHTIAEYKGVVTGEAVLSMRFTKDVITDLLGGRLGAHEKEFDKARNFAYDMLGKRAQQMGANAIVGIDIDYQTVGKESAMMLVSISGTAVIIR